MRIGLALVFSMLVASHAPLLAAEAAPPASGTIRDMSTISVTESHPGPGMWRVRGPDGHVLRVLGTISPLPADLQWRTSEVEAAITSADVVLGPPSLVVNADIGFFSGMALVPAALAARRNPDGARLEDVLSKRQYARWSRLKDRYLGFEFGIERWRPLFAAERLFSAALEEHGMKRGVVDGIVGRATKATGGRTTPVTLNLTIADPRGLLKGMKRAELDDVACLDQTMAVIERRMPVLVARADAWANGDIGVLAQLPGAEAENDCLVALLETEFVRNQDGVGDVPGKMRETWLGEAEKALAGHANSFAVLSMDQVLGEDGYLAELAARGYRVEAP